MFIPLIHVSGRLVVLVAVIALGCNLLPASNAQNSRFTQTPVAEQQSGVRVIVMPKRWSGVPEELPELATPLYLHIENKSNRLLRLRYDAFELIGANEKVLTAQAPYNLEIDGVVIRPVLLPKNYLGLAAGGFTPAPHYRTPERDNFLPRHPWNYDGYTPRYNLWVYPLPTEDMLAKGIVEGTLDPGGKATGYLYFPELPDVDRRLAFKMQLIDAQTGQAFGSIRMPLEMGEPGCPNEAEELRTSVNPIKV